MEISLETSGLSTTLRAIGRLPNSIRKKAVRSGLKAGGKIIKDAAVKNIKAQQSDRATGKLAKSIVVKNLKNKGKDLRVAVAINKAVSRAGVRVGLYGSVFEFGKKGQRPRPSLRPAIKDNKTQAINAVTDQTYADLDKAVEDAKR